jgi:hypothetical protein
MMRKAVCFAAGAAAILLTAPAPARHYGGVVSGGGARTVFHRHGGSGRLTGGSLCGRVATRDCFDFARRDRGRGTRDYGWAGFGYGGLLVDPDALRDEGFFAETGDSWTENGRAVYDYDRSYPYDWYRGPGPAPAGARAGASPPAVHCNVSWVSGDRGAPAPVRVCRGRR